MDVLVVGTLAVFGTSLGLVFYRKRLELKLRRLKKEVEKLEAEKAKYLV